MRKKLIVFVLLIVSYECNGDLLRGILGGAQEVQKQIHGAAGAFLGGISQGFNLHGQFGINKQQNNGNRPQKPTETIVVIVNNPTTNDGSSDGYQNRPPNENRPQQNYNPNNFVQHNPPNNVNNNHRPQNNQGQHNRPGYGNNNNQNYRPGYGNGNQNNFRPTNKPNYGQNNNPGYENQNQNNYGKPNSGQNSQQDYGNQNQNNFGQTNKPNFNQNSQPNLPAIFDNSNNNNGQVNTPGYGQYNPPNQNNNVRPNPTGSKEIQHSTEKIVENKKPNNDDEPLFVPLHPNEYIYGGDKIHVESPKRETEDKPKPVNEEEEEFPIDARIKDE